MVSQSFGNDLPCLKCHSDKRGPFVFEHAPVRVEGCPTCHNPHGSTNPRLLARPAVFTMCLECHNSVMGFGLRGEGIPNPGAGFHNIAEPRFQNCVTCHVRIHGSNADPLFRR
jgi:DmsE family decaheme c-type cytochrome